MGSVPLVGYHQDTGPILNVKITRLSCGYIFWSVKILHNQIDTLITMI